MPGTETSLLFDLGNSYLKYALSSCPDNIERIHLNDLSVALPDMLQTLQRLPARCYLSAVGADAALDLTLRSLTEAGIGVSRISHASLADHVQLAYEDPSALGIDRALGMFAAVRQAPGLSLAVISVGTAVTADLVSAEGTHIGGYIFPSPYIQLRSMSARIALPDTALEEWSGNLLPGRNTHDCMVNGAVMSVVGGIDMILSRYSPDLCLITGGMAEALIPFLRYENITYGKNLVINALSCLAEEQM